jgi:hypothetical protein
MVLTTIKSFLMALLSHCSKNSANRVANRPAQGGILLVCAISLGQDAGCSRSGCGFLFATADCCRIVCCAAQRIRAKSLAHADTHRFPDTGL